MMGECPIKKRYLSFLSISTLLISCASAPEVMQKHIAEGNLAETVKIGEEFLVQKPDSPDATKVRQLLLDADLRIAKSVNTVQSYDVFESKHPGSPYAAEAKDLKSRVYYQGVIVPTATPEACREFRSLFPESSLVKESKEFELRLAWARTQKAGTVESYSTFLKDYQTFAHVEEAQNKLCALGWQQAAKEDSVSAYERFAKEFPKCVSQIASAKDKMSERAWSAAVIENTWAGYRKYRELFPNSKHDEEAAEKEQAAWLFSGPVGIIEYITAVTSMNDVDPNNIKLFVQVNDDGGKMVGGLPAGNFSIYENGCEVKIKNFEGMESERPVDVVFVLDTTGSMKKEITGVKNAITQFVENLRLGNRDARVGLVTFGETVREVFSPSADVQEFKGWIAEEIADGGSVDDNENVLEALNAAVKFDFRNNAQRVFILVTDAPFHEKNAVTQLTTSEIAGKLKSNGVMLVSVSPEFTQYKSLVGDARGKLFNLLQVKNYNELIDSISVMTAKQYRLTYADSHCALAKGDRSVRVRAKKEFVWSFAGKLNTSEAVEMVADSVNFDTMYIATRDSGLFKSDENGGWSSINSGLPELSLKNIIPVPGREGWLLVQSTTDKIYLSCNFGGAWKAISTPSVFISIIGAPNLRLYATDGQSLFSSADGGLTWVVVSRISPVRTNIVLSFDPILNSIVTLCENGGAKFSTDGGISWIVMGIKSPEPKGNLVGFHYYRPSAFGGIVYMLKPGGCLYLSRNAGLVWENITPVFAAGNVFVNDVWFDPTGRQGIIVSTSQGMFSSLSDGTSWTPFGEGTEVKDFANSILVFTPKGKIRTVCRKTGNLYNFDFIKDREFISGNVYFDTGSANINISLYGFLEQLVKRLNENLAFLVRIEGHTDDVGKDDMNMRLSQSRAESVKEYLVRKGISPSRIFTTGYGKNRPIAPNISVKNRAKNRRVELLLLG